MPTKLFFVFITSPPLFHIEIEYVMKIEMHGQQYNHLKYYKKKILALTGTFRNNLF